MVGLNLVASARGNGQQGRQQQHQQQQKQVPVTRPPAAAAEPKTAYSVAPKHTRPSRPVPDSLRRSEDAVQPVEHQQLDDPLLWPEHSQEQQQQGEAKLQLNTAHTDTYGPSTLQAKNPLRLPAARRQTINSNTAAATAGPTSGVTQPDQVHNTQGHRDPIRQLSTPPATRYQGRQTHTHKHPPVAPEDPAELLKVLQVMDPPRRRIVIFKGGGYIYSEMEALIESAGLGHVMRLTNLMRKAHCIVAKECRDTGKRVNLSEHIAAARNANIPFLLIKRLEAQELVGILRPLLVRKRILVEHPQRRTGAAQQDAVAAGAGAAVDGQQDAAAAAQ